jgi:hypothetical protein
LSYLLLQKLLTFQDLTLSTAFSDSHAMLPHLFHVSKCQL